MQRQSVAKQVAAIQPRLAERSKQIVHVTSTPVLEVPAAAEMPDASWPLPLAQLDCPPIARFDADALIGSAAHAEQISPSLLRAVIKRESGFHPCAVSAKGAQGLMQLMPATAQQFGVFDPFDPAENIRGGASLLKQLLARYGGDVRLALSAYNAGSERVEEAGGIPDIAETQNYVAAITEDLGMPDEPVAAAPSNAFNTMTKPDFSHVVLASPTLNFAPKPTSVHLASEQ